MDLNLVQHRDERSVWDQLECGRDTERWVAATLASAFFIAGLRRRSATGLLLTIAGGTLAWWACTGADQRTQWRGHVRAALPQTRSVSDPVMRPQKNRFRRATPQPGRRFPFGVGALVTPTSIWCITSPASADSHSAGGGFPCAE